MLEQRFERGGTMASDDYSTPFTYNQAQAALPLGADNPVVTGLGLAGHGVAFVEPAVAVEVLTSGGALTVGPRRSRAGRDRDGHAGLGQPGLHPGPVPAAAAGAEP